MIAAERSVDTGSGVSRCVTKNETISRTVNGQLAEVRFLVHCGVIASHRGLVNSTVVPRSPPPITRPAIVTDPELPR